MKKAVLFAILLLIILILRNIFAAPSPGIKKTNNTTLNITTPTPPTTAHTIDYELNGETFRAAWFIANPGSITLTPNFTTKLTAREYKAQEGCRSLSNAGFYSTSFAPIGLFIHDGNTLNNFTENMLLNGIFSISSQGLASISVSPLPYMRIAVQTGPILLSSGKKTLLAIKNDEPSRRVVVGITNDHSVVFSVFYNPENPYLGPLLELLPEHISVFKRQSGISLSDAINLDGGSASAFMTKGLDLEELTTVGSFFCIR